MAPKSKKIAKKAKIQPKKGIKFVALPSKKGMRNRSAVAVIPEPSVVEEKRTRKTEW